MANKIIAFLPVSVIIGTLNNRNAVGTYVWNIVRTIKSSKKDIRISSKLSDEYKCNDSTEYSVGDNIILYQDNGPICLGRWATTTIKNTESYKEELACITVTDFLTKLNTYSNENRLQSPEAPSGERDGSKGIAIEVAGSVIEVETRPLDHGTVISY